MSRLIRSCAAVTVAAALARGTVDVAHADADEGDGVRALHGLGHRRPLGVHRTALRQRRADPCAGG